MNIALKASLSTAQAFGTKAGDMAALGAQLDAIKTANALPYSFQSAIFTKDINTAFYAVKRLKAEAVMVNEHTAFRVDWMPFGGSEQSGLGTGGIGYSIKDMTREKLMVLNLS